MDISEISESSIRLVTYMQERLLSVFSRLGMYTRATSGLIKNMGIINYRIRKPANGVSFAEDCEA